MLKFSALVVAFSLAFLAGCTDENMTPEQQQQALNKQIEQLDKTMQDNTTFSWGPVASSHSSYDKQGRLIRRNTSVGSSSGSYTEEYTAYPEKGYGITKTTETRR